MREPNPLRLHSREQLQELAAGVQLIWRRWERGELHLSEQEFEFLDTHYWHILQCLGIKPFIAKKAKPLHERRNFRGHRP